MNWKASGGKHGWSNFKALSEHFPGERETITDLSQYSQSQGSDFNSGTPKYKREALTTQQ
jgi:hypothetical protein